MPSNVCARRRHPNSDAARAYAVLTYRCVDSLSIEEIEAKLGLSRRQTYREYARGVDAVAGQLWDELNRRAENAGTTADTVSPPSEPGTSRETLAKAELERLSKEVSFEPVIVAEVMGGVCKLLALRMQQRGIQITALALDSCAACHG